nr:reverse transcriptase domain-containing protein [Tanacetum cinerariifolium]
MRTRSSFNLLVVSSNPLTLNPKCRNRRRSKQPFILEESPIDMMAGQRTMAELLRAPTKGYAEAILVCPILADQFELRHSLINMMTTDQFFGLEKDNPYDHIRWGSPPVARKRTLAGALHNRCSQGKELGLINPLSEVLATEWITLAFQLVLIDMGPVLQVQHQGLSRFGIQLVKQVAVQASLLERLPEIPVRLAHPQVVSPPTYLQASWM